MNRIHSAHQASCCVHRGWIRTADGMELRAGSTIMESGSPLLVASRVSDADAPNGSSIAICAIWRDQRSTGQRHFNIICNIGLVARASVLVALRGPSPLSFRLSFWGGWGGTRVLPPAPPSLFSLKIQGHQNLSPERRIVRERSTTSALPWSRRHRFPCTCPWIAAAYELKAERRQPNPTTDQRRHALRASSFQLPRDDHGSPVLFRNS